MVITNVSHVSPSTSESLPFVERFDAFLRIETHQFRDFHAKKKKKARLENGAKQTRASSELLQILQKGFGDRVLLLEEAPATDGNDANHVVIGLRLNPSSYQRVIDRGPPADSAEAKSFRQLWGDKSEMRKFADGAIYETVVWRASNVMERRRLIESIAEVLLEKHFSIAPDSVHLTQYEIESVLIPSPSSPWCGITTTGEEQFRALSETYDKLSNILRSVDGLPLTLNRIQAVSPSLRHTEVFPPITTALPKAKACVYVRDSSFIPRPSGLYAPPWRPSYEVQIGLEASSKWPDDLHAVRKLKCAFYLKLSELLRDQFNLKSQVFGNRLLVIVDSFVFCIVIVYPREVALLKTKKDERGVLISRNTKESLAVEMATVHAPTHAAYSLGMVHAHGSFSLTCRLVRRWICCHMLSDFVRLEVVELLVASLYLDCSSWGVPCSPFSGFLKFLRLLIGHDWLTSPLLVNFNNELTEEQWYEIRSKFVSLRPTLPPMCVVTPYDHVGNRWTRPQPTAMILERLCNLAKAGLDVLEINAFRLTGSIVRTVFQPTLNVYDALIRLRCRRVPKRYMALKLPEMKIRKKNDEFPSRETRDDRFPVVDFDPVERFLHVLREKYDRFAMFFYDACGGDVIGVLWKPVLKTEVSGQKTTSKNEEGEDCKKTRMPPTVSAMLEDFSSLGKGLVDEVESLKPL